MPELLKGQKFVVGLDIGSASIGWAVLLSRDGEPTGIAGAGVHCFDAGVEGDLESGRESSRAAARRNARLPRRQIWRRARRKLKIIRVLQRHGLMPQRPLRRPQDIHELIGELDSQLTSQIVPDGDRRAAHLLPYLIRKEALSRRLEAHAVGRALYHLAQRRGFLSNRKADRAKDDELGKVAAGIDELTREMQSANASTLGEYFATVDPAEQRIRGRYTARPMYREEFERIWGKQAEFHPELNQTAKEQIHKAIFFQRPLRSQKNLVGCCSLIPGQRRAPVACRIAQRFRMLQKVNDLCVDQPDGIRRPLTAEERSRVLALLSTRGDMKLTTLRGKQGLRLPPGCKFNLEEGGEERITGLRTDSELAKVFDERWTGFSEQEKDRIVEALLSFEKSEPLIGHAIRIWKLSREQSNDVAGVHLEPGYSMHCRKALHRLVARMEEGTPYMTARKEEFPESMARREPLELLPPVRDAIPDLRNPAVCRALTEVRKLVNAIIRRYGKPEKIRIELARDLKQPRKLRERIWRANRQREQRRKAAIARLLEEARLSRPRQGDIEKVLLAEECGWKCPYTGRDISMRSLVGEFSQFDVEHIWPFSRSFDNSFANKTLCYHEENRKHKENRTPYEAYAGNATRWNEIIERVRTFRGDLAAEKLRRFRAEEIPEGFTQRQMSDTRYASRLAGDYLAALFGGRADDEGQRVEMRPGGLTAHIRRELMLNAVLGNADAKNRTTHLHHAVDAVAVGLASQGMVQRFQKAAERAREKNRRLFAPVREPWLNFVDEVRNAVESIKVSHRPSRGIGGGLHADSLYSKPIVNGQGQEVRHIRKALAKLSKPEIENGAIADPVVGRLVRQAWEAAGKEEPSKVFADASQHPRLTTRTSQTIPIHKVRVRTDVKPRAIGQAERLRHVAPAPGSNHHAVIVAVLDEEGREIRWEDHVVNRLEVYERKSKGQPLIQRDWGPGMQFKFTLARNDFVTMEDSTGHEQLYRVLSVSPRNIELRRHDDARVRKQIKEMGERRVTISGTRLFTRKGRKVRINYLGEVMPAND